MTLSLHKQRVLGALMEKEIATPETYPLSLNALVNACNQRSSRDPILDLTEDEVREALDGLEALGLTARLRDSRVPKFEHRARTALNLRRDETAVVCLLLLRGPQTPGELRSRSDRLHAFEEVAAVQSTLDRLANRPLNTEVNAEMTGPLVITLPRQPGSRESRYAHLLGESVTVTASSASPINAKDKEANRLERFERELAELRARLEAIERKM